MPFSSKQNRRGTPNDDGEVGLEPIVNSLPPNEHNKSIKQELEEVRQANSNDEEIADGVALSKAPSRKEFVVSKARLVALVLTLTGASFLNVSPFYVVLRSNLSSDACSLTASVGLIVAVFQHCCDETLS